MSIYARLNKPDAPPLAIYDASETQITRQSLHAAWLRVDHPTWSEVKAQYEGGSLRERPTAPTHELLDSKLIYSRVIKHAIGTNDGRKVETWTALLPSYEGTFLSLVKYVDASGTWYAVEQSRAFVQHKPTETMHTRPATSLFTGLAAAMKYFEQSVKSCSSEHAEGAIVLSGNADGDRFHDVQFVAASIAAWYTHEFEVEVRQREARERREAEEREAAEREAREAAERAAKGDFGNVDDSVLARLIRERREKKAQAS